jgi:hypothetical protein
MAAPVLTDEQKQKLIEWLAAGYSGPLIQQCFLARGWKPIAQPSIHYYRDQHRETIDTRSRERLEAAFDAGLAQKEARIKALVQHAETLQELKWTPDEKGKLHNEKAWRETLADIAQEMGHRRQGVDLFTTFGKMTDAELDEYIAAAQRALLEDSAGDPALAAAGGPAEAGTAADPLSE